MKVQPDNAGMTHEPVGERMEGDWQPIRCGGGIVLPWPMRSERRPSCPDCRASASAAERGRA
jgi:hypothetical protein